MRTAGNAARFRPMQTGCRSTRSPDFRKLSDEATMQIQNIDCDKIEFRELPGATPVLSVKTARELADNIEAVGLLHPIAVRPRSDTPGCYWGIHGRHRYHASACCSSGRPSSAKCSTSVKRRGSWSPGLKICSASNRVRGKSPW